MDKFSVFKVKGEVSNQDIRGSIFIERWKSKFKTSFEQCRFVFLELNFAEIAHPWVEFRMLFGF